MSRLDTGNMSLIPKSESLNQLMQELKLSFEHVKDRAVLKISIPTEDTIAYLDKGRLMQVLTNMVNNSRKFTPETGLIEVGYSIINSRIELFVKDNGKGIPKEKQKDIFNRFFKVNEGDVGTGLGLAISKSIVDQMNGFIQVESEEGKGTAFYISLPLMTEPAVN
jgi:signal transduction histidine kinase